MKGNIGNTTSGNLDLCRDFIRERGFMPDGKPMPVRKMARILYGENPLRFKDEERCRVLLNKVRGKGYSPGIKDDGLFEKENRSCNPYLFPDSDEIEWLPYIIEAKRVGLLMDIHIPYHSISGLTAAFDWLKPRNPDVILLNGDAIDAHPLSRYVKDPKKRDFAGELQVFAEFFQILQKTFPKAQIILKIGNHEERYEQFLYQKAGEISGIKEFQLEEIIKARAEGIIVVKDKRIIKAGGLNIIHGHEFASGFFSPVNVARGLFLRAKVSAVQGHNHQVSEHSEPNLNGELITTWSGGCLCELHPPYMPINKWSHGVMDVELDGNAFHVTNKRIMNGKVL